MVNVGFRSIENEDRRPRSYISSTRTDLTLTLITFYFKYIVKISKLKNVFQQSAIGHNSEKKNIIKKSTFLPTTT